MMVLYVSSVSALLESLFQERLHFSLDLDDRFGLRQLQFRSFGSRPRSR